ncbi:tetratricopeptide repeat protein [Massilia genomosp. 1]|uniref:Tetratricopeptide repeat protein n=1 Tax=Massilia genomosp. 1 TaxID=2609280 RepID=A0ABX0MPL4_9BURK|nr:tetratricopeptide repeat protein [Massilia genomosp. 1]NHZ64710.1 tetratricopeptide repeat protein [Massilia genomosp. 1]
MELDGKLAVEVKEICDEGDVLIEIGELDHAFRNFSEALSLIPEPREEYRETAGILAGLGDVYFHAKSFAQGREVLSDAMHCTGAIGNPFLHLRLGQCQLELDNSYRAADELVRAYMGGGKEIFEREDPKYFIFLQGQISPPASGIW